jgi:TP901-1 family phage major tail protein
MAAASGRRLRILRGNDASPEVFSELSGAREESLSINNELLDITDKDSGGWRTYISGEVGVQSMSMSCSGVLIDDDMIQHLLNKIALNYQFEIENLGVFEGLFMIASMELSGAHEGVETYTLSFESSGAIAFTPEA